MKNTNKALFSSVVALILCCSMLIGSTFAWFTDSVKSDVNKIIAGNLDVDVLTADGKSIQGQKTLFDEIKLWEPGVVAYENLTVVNKGNLALKYELSINFTNATPNAKGNTLADVLQVGVVEGGVQSTTREGVLGEVKQWSSLKNFIESGELLTQGAEKEYGIVIYWAPGANDNDYNMNNGQTTVLSIDLGVNLVAYQKDHEKDSFDKEYDAVVHTAKQLADALAAGGNIKVGSDIELTETVEIPADVTATLDLNGKTLTGAIKAPDAELTITNGTLKNDNSDVSALEINAGKLTLDNVQVDSARHGLRVDGNVEVTINGGTYGITSSGKTQHALNVSGNAKVTINGGTFVGPKGTTADSGAAVNVQAGANVIINGGNFSGGKNNTLASKGTLTVYGGTFDQDPSAYVADGYVAAKTGDNTWTVVKGDIAVSNADELAAAVAAGKTDIYLLDGEYDVDGCGGKTLTISGSKNAVITVVGTGKGEANGQLDYGFDGSNLTFNGVTIKTNNQTYAGYARLNATYNDCTFENTYCLNGESEFNRCTFNISGDQYNIWTWGAPEATFTGCTFNSDGKAMLLYGTANTKLTLNDCVFNDTGILPDLKAAIEIGNDYGKSYELVVNNTVVNGYEINDKGINTGTTLWGNKNGMSCEKLKVVIDGVAQVWDAAGLTEAIKNGGKIAFASDITVDKWIMFSETLSIGSGQIITLDEINLTIDGNGHTLTVNSIESAKNGDQLFHSASNLNISNLTIKYADGLATGGIGLKSGVISNVNFVGGTVAIQPLNGDIKIENCTFATNGTAIYFEQERDNLTVTGCTFNQPAGTNVILLHGDVKFTNNTINSGRTVNIVSGSPVVTGNNFNNVRLKVYSAATATISGNTINNLVFEDNATTYSSTFENNTLSTEAQAALNAVTKEN